MDLFVAVAALALVAGVDVWIVWTLAARLWTRGN